MIRNLFVLVVLIVSAVTGCFVSESFGCDTCIKAQECLEVDAQDLCLIDELIKRQDTTTAEGVAVVEGLIELQLRLRAKPPHVVTKDVTFLEGQVVAQKKRLIGTSGDAREREIGVLEELISLYLRAKVCTTRQRIGIPPKAPKCAIMAGGKVVMSAPSAAQPTCCSKAPTTCCDKGHADCCPPMKVIQQFIVENERPITHRVGGFNVSTCQGPISVGPVEIQGGGRESNLYAGTLLETTLRTQQGQFNGAMDAQRNCRIQTTTPRICYGRICHSVQRRSSCSSSNGGGGGYCQCQNHARRVRELHGPYADPRQYPCLCTQPCNECSNTMEYLAAN